jgi:hypothetical protein
LVSIDTNKAEKKMSDDYPFPLDDDELNFYPKIECVLSHRVEDGKLQYLIRYEDKEKYKEDVWEDSTFVTDESKLKDYWENSDKSVIPETEKIEEIEAEESCPSDEEEDDELKDIEPDDMPKIIQIKKDDQSDIVLLEMEFPKSGRSVLMTQKKVARIYPQSYRDFVEDIIRKKYPTGILSF